MPSRLSKTINFLYGPYFKVAGFFYRIYVSNRAFAERIMGSPRMAAFLRVLAVAILFGWILIWLTAPEESRNRLTDEVKQSIGGFGAETNRDSEAVPLQ